MKISKDIARQTANVIFAFGQIICSFIPQIFHLGVGIGQGAKDIFTPLMPISDTFAIWAILFPLMIGYALYQALPSQRENPLLRRMGWYSAWALAITCVWVTIAQLVPSFTIGDPFFAATVLILYGKALMQVVVSRHTISRADYILVYFPFSAITGWIVVATLVCMSTWLQYGPLQNFGLGSTVASCILLIAGTWGVNLFIRFCGGNLFYAIPVVWGLAGISLTNIYVQYNKYVATVAAVAAVYLVCLSLALWLGHIIIRRTTRA